MKKIVMLFVLLTFFVTGISLDAFAKDGQDLGKIVVTATRIGQHDYKVTGNVSVISREEIEASNAQNIPDVLEEALGVYVYDKNTTKTSTIDIRGFGDTATRNVLVLVNDRKINPVDMSGPDLLQISLDAVEKIEIIRGAGSVLYGDNAVGGVVNIITKKGNGDLSGKFGVFYGNYDAQGTNAEVSGEYKDVSYYFHSKYFDQRGYRDNSDVLSKDFNARLGYQFNDRVSADIDIGVHKDTFDLPGGLDESELVSLGRTGSANNNDVATTEDEYYKLNLDINPWPEDVYYGAFVIDLMYRDRHGFDSFSGYDTDRNIITKGITGKYVFDRVIFDKEVNFVTGIDYYDAENDIVGSGSNADNLVISKEELGIYGYLQYELFDNVFVNGGTRYHMADYAFSKRNVFSDEKQNPDEWVSMGGIKYEYAEGSNVHFNVQQTFRFLATDEWYSSWSGLNTDLSQQTGIQYELGLKHKLSDGVTVNATPYLIENKNEIFYDPNAGFWGSNSNYDKTRRIGVEVGSKVDILSYADINFMDKFEAFSNYTFQNPEFVQGAYDGNDIPMVPKHQVSAGLITRVFADYNVSLIGRYVGSRFIINDTANVMPKAKPYYTLDGKVSYKKKNFEVFAEVNNILDAEYAPYQIKKTATTRDSYPAPDRNFTVGMNLKF